MDEHGKLLRVLGIAFALAVVVGGMVGQGIMRAPGVVAGAMVEPWAILLVWLVGGVLSAIDAFAVAELSASHPCAGGPYAFARRAFGPLAGTVTGWADWLQLILALAFVAVVFGEYVHALGIATTLPVGAIAALLIAASGALHWRGTQISGASQTIGTLIKAAMMVGLVAVLAFAPTGTTEPAPPLSPMVGFAGVVVSIRVILATYSGWSTGSYFCEEIREPERNVVRATFGGIAAVTALYVAVNAALLSALTPAQIAASKLPAAVALQSALGGVSGTVITVMALVSVAAIVNLLAMQTPRIAFAVSRDGALPAFLCRIAPGGTPRAATLATLIPAMAFAMSGSYETLIAMSAVPAALIFLITDLCAIRLRQVEPNLPRPFRMPLFPFPALLGAALNTLLIAGMIWEDPANSLYGVVMLLAVAAVYALRQRSVRRAPA